MKVFAHRGISALHPENSQTALSHCNNAKMHGVEVDIFQVESEFYIVHDRWLTRTFNIDKKITELSTKEASKLLGRDGKPIPTLTWLIKEFAGKNLELNLELKQVRDIDLFIEQLFQLCIESNFPIELIIISSFNHQYLKAISEQQPEVKIGLLMANYPIDIGSTFHHFPIYSVHLDMDCISSELIQSIKQLGFPVYVFTVDQHSEIEWLHNNKVDGIFANNPENAYEIINKLI